MLKASSGSVGSLSFGEIQECGPCARQAGSQPRVALFTLQNRYVLKGKCPMLTNPRGSSLPADDIVYLSREVSMENLQHLQRYSEKLQFEATCVRLWANGIHDQIMDEQEKVQNWILGMTDEINRVRRVQKHHTVQHQWSQWSQHLLQGMPLWPALQGMHHSRILQAQIHEQKPGLGRSTSEWNWWCDSRSSSHPREVEFVYLNENARYSS